MKLLCRDGSYGPYILSGAENRVKHDKPLSVRALFDAYQVVAVEDGSVSYRVDGTTRHPQMPCALLIQPERDVVVDLPRGVTWHLLRFDAMYQARKPVGGRRLSAYEMYSFAHRRAGRQPPAEAIWGIDLPLAIPRDMVRHTLARIRWCNAHWWLGGLEYARANCQLGIWLLDLVNRVRGNPVGHGGWLAQLKRFCFENIVHDVSVADMAVAAGISRQYLRVKLLEACSLTPKEFLDAIRMDMACKRLLNADDSIATISHHCGYHTAPVFSRRFKKHMGVSPRRWRQEHRLSRALGDV